jgi:hypothetical protein
MHASIEQLLDIKDGIESPMTGHVESCDQCQAELAYLDKMGQQVFEAMDNEPPSGSWDRILSESGLQVAETHSTPHMAAHAIDAVKSPASLSRSIYTLAASIMFVGLVSIFMVSQQNSVRQQTGQMQATIDQLMLNSRGLETVLQQVVVQDERLSEEDRAEAERLYWRLTYVDQELHNVNPDEPEDAERIQILWNDRIEVLNELNRLFYQRQDTLASSAF